MVKTTNHSVSVEAYYTRYPRACVHLPCNVFIVGVSGGALVNIVPTKACVAHNECRITLQQPRSSIWKPRWRYRSSVSYSVLLVYGPKYWEIRRDTQIWDSYLIKTFAWKATIVSIYSVCVCWVGDGELQLHTAVCTSLSCQYYSFQEIFTSFLLQKCTFVIHTVHCHNESPLNTSPGTVTLKVCYSAAEWLWNNPERQRPAKLAVDLETSNLLKHVKLSTKSRLCQKSKYISFCLVTKYLTRIMVQPPMDMFTFDHVLISENSK